MIRKIKLRDNSLLKTKEVMSTKLNNFSYNALVSTNVYGMKFNISLNCKEDRINKLGYCNVNSNIVSLEEYMDYKNNVTYTKTDVITNDSFSWQKNTHNNIGEVTPILNTLDHVSIQKKEKKDNGILYTGVINGKSLSGIFKTVNTATSNRINISSLFKKKVPVTVFVNNDNYVENFSFTTNLVGISVNCNINYTDFNTTPSLSLPGELNGL